MFRYNFMVNFFHYRILIQLHPEKYELDQVLESPALFYS